MSPALPQPAPDRGPKAAGGGGGQWLAGAGLVAAGLIGFLLFRPATRPDSGATPDSKPASVEADRQQLELREGRLFRLGSQERFSGLMTENYPNGVLRSRSAVTNGQLHGLSEGFYTNGQRQVTEFFREGVSHGTRTKWRMSGAKASEASIVAGQIHGPFRKWYENGALAEEAEFVQGKPHGVSQSFFEDGRLKAKVVMQGGQVVSEERAPEAKAGAAEP